MNEFMKKERKFMLGVASSAMGQLLRRLGYDATWQFRFNFIFAALWFTSMFMIPIWYHPAGADAWLALGVMEVSLWANFATHLGAVTAGLAAMGISNYTTDKAAAEDHTPPHMDLN